MKPRILIVYTGGTIGMIEDAATKALRPFDFSHLMENVPKVKKLDYVIDNIQFQTPTQWPIRLRLSRSCYRTCANR